MSELDWILFLCRVQGVLLLMVILIPMYLIIWRYIMRKEKEEEDKEVTRKNPWMCGLYTKEKDEWKTGEWKKITKHYKDAEQEFNYYEIRCSVCNNPPEKAWHLTRFCPHCGTMMKGE